MPSAGLNKIGLRRYSAKLETKALRWWETVGAIGIFSEPIGYSVFSISAHYSLLAQLSENQLPKRLVASIPNCARRKTLTYAIDCCVRGLISFRTPNCGQAQRKKIYLGGAGTICALEPQRHDWRLRLLASN